MLSTSNTFCQNKKKDQANGWRVEILGKVGKMTRGNADWVISTEIDSEWDKTIYMDFQDVKRKRETNGTE